ncbi:methylglyoxal synthase [Caldovatus aquaticus]|uniref:Methylglyoxal synthase n=1 Tax=Caldovatus aquaticus TaxID=2865671 RepID=A0ABS7F556_9PROT|nr:methylglyoxal synthase [Caldovatus aquaticus]MBW8270750.1 methylglyoxal synthase [Caldovatus aquaticus]
MSLTIALVAHDAAKPALVEWVGRHIGLLRPHHLLATGTTGARLRERYPELRIEAVLSGPLGGDQQIGARVAEGRVDAIVFLFDPLWAQPHEPDVRALIRIAALRDVPIAVNLATAELLAAALPGMAARKAAAGGPAAGTGRP